MMPTEPKLLLIETSGAVGHVGLSAGRRLAGEAALDRGRQHTRDLMPQCQRLFAEARWKPGDVDAIVVSTGPGSYTGLRVGIMTAKTLAYALRQPLISVPTFEIIARRCFDEESSLLSLTVIGDGQQDRVYVQQFERMTDSGSLFTMSPLTIMGGEAWRASVPAGSALTGPGLRQQQQKVPPTVDMLDEKYWDPFLASFLQLGLEHLEKKQFADAMALEPLYLRASSAEEQWEMLGK